MPAAYLPCTSYGDTLNAFFRSLKQLPPLHHLLLDSFWYGEGIYNGVSLWEDNADLQRVVQSFPASLKALIDTLDPQIAVWAHNGKFIDASPYLSDPRFHFAAGDIPQGTELWDHLFPLNKQTWRLAQIKQDHVGDYLRAAGVISNASVMEAWMGGMAESAARVGVSVQYCCSPPTVLHAGVEYSNAVIGVRASPDYVANANGGVRPLFQWAIGAESAFHWLGLGLLPDKDTTITNAGSQQHGGDNLPAKYAPSFYGFEEKNALKHVLFAALSGGPTSFSDAVDAANVTLLGAVTRSDGIVLRTSRTQTAVDAEFYAIMFGAWAGTKGTIRSEAGGAKSDSSLPNGALGEIYSSVTLVSGLTWHTITAAQLAAPVSLHSAELGINSTAAQTLVAVPWDLETFSPRLPSAAFQDGAALTLTAGAAYEDVPSLVLLSPQVDAQGSAWVLLGEVGKAVPISPQRIQGVRGEGGTLVVDVLGGAAGELVTLAACQVQRQQPFRCSIVSLSCPAPGTFRFPGTCA
jgi:hypothetical protein